MAKKRTPVQRHNDALFTAAVRRELQNQHAAGLKQGVYAVCKVVNEKATVDGKTAEERLNDIIAFVAVWGKTKDEPKNAQQFTEESHEV